MKTKKKIWLLLLGVLTSQIFIAQTSNDNYVREITYLDGQGQNTLTNVTYHDGLGRPMQTATQGVNTTGKYIYQRQVYDARGRVVEESLPPLRRHRQVQKLQGLHENRLSCHLHQERQGPC